MKIQTRKTTIAPLKSSGSLCPSCGLVKSGSKIRDNTKPLEVWIGDLTLDRAVRLGRDATKLTLPVIVFDAVAIRPVGVVESGR
jgi:hypothetical protein